MNSERKEEIKYFTLKDKFKDIEAYKRLNYLY